MGDNDNKKSVMILIIVILAFLLLVGTYAAMFIPAYAGYPLNEIAVFASPFWTSMFFLFLWKYLNKKALHGFILGIIIGLVVWFCAAFYSGFG